MAPAPQVQHYDLPLDSVLVHVYWIIWSSYCFALFIVVRGREANSLHDFGDPHRNLRKTSIFTSSDKNLQEYYIWKPGAQAEILRK